MVTDLVAAKAGLLAKLEGAGAEGLNKTDLGIRGSPKRGQLYAQALRELEHDRLIGNLGTISHAKYVLRDHFRPLELAYDHIAAKAGRDKPMLFNKAELAKGLTGAVREKVDEAIHRLQEDGKVLRLQRGITTYYLHTASFPAASIGVDAKVRESLTREPVLSAYHAVVKETALPNVGIDQLWKRLDGVTLTDLQAFLAQECRSGRAIPSRGDWSLSSEAARAAALYIDGQPYVLIRFPG